MILHADCAAPDDVRGAYQVIATWIDAQGGKVGDLHVFTDAAGLGTLATMLVEAARNDGPEHGAVRLYIDVALPR